MIIYMKGYASTEDDVQVCPYCGMEISVPEDGVITCFSCGRRYAVIHPEDDLLRCCSKNVRW